MNEVTQISIKIHLKNKLKLDIVLSKQSQLDEFYNDLNSGNKFIKLGQLIFNIDEIVFIEV